MNRRTLLLFRVVSRPRGRTFPNGFKQSFQALGGPNGTAPGVGRREDCSTKGGCQGGSSRKSGRCRVAIGDWLDRGSRAARRCSRIGSARRSSTMIWRRARDSMSQRADAYPVAALQPEELRPRVDALRNDATASAELSDTASDGGKRRRIARTQPGLNARRASRNITWHDRFPDGILGVIWNTTTNKTAALEPGASF